MRAVVREEVKGEEANPLNCKKVSGKDNPLLGRHLGRLAAMLADVARAEAAGKESEAVAGLRSTLGQCLGVQLDGAQGAALQSGLAGGLRALARLPPAFWSEQRAAVARLVPPDRDWEQVWARDVALIDLAFLGRIHALVCQHFGA